MVMRWVVVVVVKVVMSDGGRVVEVGKGGERCWNKHKQTAKKSIIKHILQYRIEMFQQSPSNFHPPRCNYQCVKNAYVTLLLSNQQKQLKNFEWRSAGAINSFSKFVYIPSGSSSEVVATCGRGFMLFKEKVCLPCLEGWYGDGKGLCKKCGYFWYQPRFASSSCLLCPYLSFSLLATKTHPQQCVAFSSNTAAQNYVIIFFVIISFVFWVCSLQCGLLPCLYQPITSQPRNKVCSD